MKPTSPADLISEIRSHTRPIHDRIERLPIARALMDGRITRASYVELLGRLYWVHSIFEKAKASHEELASLWPMEAIRADAIARDLQALGTKVELEIPKAVARWRDDLESRARSTPSVWGGAGYVLEGSRLGGQFLIAPIARGLGLSPDEGIGLDYHREGVENIGERWHRVRECLVTLDRSPETRPAIVHGAVVTFELLFYLHNNIPMAAPIESLDQIPGATIDPD